MGFAALPNQLHRKSVKKGFDFTLMVAGLMGFGQGTGWRGRLPPETLAVSSPDQVGWVCPVYRGVRPGKIYPHQQPVPHQSL